MSTEIYAIVFKGDIVDGHDPETVKAQVSKLLKADAKKTAALFSGKQIVLKKTPDKEQAAKYGRVLKKAGADVKIRIIKAEAAKPKPNKAVFQTADPSAADDTPVTPKAEAAPTAEAQPPSNISGTISRNSPKRIDLCLTIQGMNLRSERQT